MSAASTIARRWKPIVLTVLFGAAEAFFINKVSADNPAWWWWLLLVVALIGVVGCALWAVLMQTGDSEISHADNSIGGDVKEGATSTQQSAGQKGRNVSVSADNGSFAAYRVDKIKDITIGEPRKKQDSGEIDSP